MRLDADRREKILTSVQSLEGGSALRPRFGHRINYSASLNAAANDRKRTSAYSFLSDLLLRLRIHLARRAGPHLRIP